MSNVKKNGEYDFKSSSPDNESDVVILNGHVMNSKTNLYDTNLDKCRQISGKPTWSNNHRTNEGNKVILPFGMDTTKMNHFGNLPIKLSLQYWYYFVSPDNFGPQYQIRLTFRPEIPLPW